MENGKDVYDRFSWEMDSFFLYSNRNFLSHMYEMLQQQKCEVYLMPPIQRRIMAALALLTPDHPIFIKELAAYCRTHKSAISRELCVLEEKGYVQIKTCQQDRRIKLVQITDEGKTMLREGDQQSVVIAREFFGMFYAEEQIEQMVVCLHKLNEFWQKLEPERYFLTAEETDGQAGVSIHTSNAMR